MNTKNTIDDPLDAVLADYFQRLDQGERVTPQALIETHPELAESLREFFDAAAILERFAGPTQAEHIQQLSLHDTSRASLVGETIVASGLASEGREAPGIVASPRPAGLQTDREADASRSPMDHFGRYELERLLGQGAMGSVYLAYDPQLQRRVALKIPKFNEQDGPDMRERFLREARSAAHLRQANICPVYDAGKIGGVHYLTMAYIEGRTLAEELRSGRTFQPQEIAAIVRKLAQALAKAHAAGIVHRDLKPGNIMLDADDEPVLMDFGLAYRAESDELRLTRSGMIVGSPAYMSPEQLDGQPGNVGPHSDIYSLGAVLYELLTGKLPFQGTMMSVIGQIAAKDPLPVGQFRPELADSPLERLCRRMMAKKPADRPASMAEVAGELAALEGSGFGVQGSEGKPAALGAGLPTPPNAATAGLPPRKEIFGRPGRRVQETLAEPSPARAADGSAAIVVGLLVVLAGLCLLPALAIVAYWGMQRSDHAERVVEDSREVIADEPAEQPIGQPERITEVRSYEGHTEHVTSLAASGDSKLIVSGSADGTVLGREIETGLSRRAFSGHRRDRQVAVDVSRDGSLIVSGDWDGKLRFSRSGAADMTEIDAHAGSVMSVTLSPDETKLLTTGGDNTAKIWSIESGEPLHVIEAAGWVSDGDFAPSGEHVVTAGFDGKVVIWHVADGTQVRELPTGGTMANCVAWAPAGDRIVAGFRDGTVRVYSAEAGIETVRLAGHTDRVRDVVFMPDGRHVISGSFDCSMRLWNAETGAELVRTEAKKRIFNALAVAPDGRHVFSAGGIWKPDEETNEWEPEFDYAVRMWKLPESAWPDQAPSSTYTESPASKE